jgi:hypothetical protein
MPVYENKEDGRMCRNFLFRRIAGFSSREGRADIYMLQVVIRKN